MRTGALGAMAFGAMVVAMLAGCASPAAPMAFAPGAAVLSFTATYDVVATPPPGLVDPEATVAGPLEMSLVIALTPEARTVLDRDLVPRPAWVLSVDLEGVEYQDRHRTYFVDAQSIVRVDTPCANNFGPCMWEEAGPATLVRWRPQGAPWPLGIGWPARLDYGMMGYQLEGRPMASAFAASDGTWTLDPTTLLADDPFFDPAATYEYDATTAIPTAMVFHTYSTKDPWTFAATRTSLDWGSPVQPVEPWPKAPWTASASRDDLFPGADDDAFGMGVTFRDGYARMFEQAPEAGAIWRDGCPMHVFVTWGGGSRFSVPVLQFLDTDSISYYLWGTDRDGKGGGWQVEYHAEGVTLLEGQWSDVERNPWQTSGPTTCNTPHPGWTQTPREFLEEAWQMPTLRSGAPCDYWLEARRMRAVDGVVFGAFSVSTSLTLWADDNDPWFGDIHDPYGGGALAKNPDSGFWDEWRIDNEDLAALEAGAAQTSPRPLPQPPPPTETGLHSAYECVPGVRDFP